MWEVQWSSDFVLRAWPVICLDQARCSIPTSTPVLAAGYLPRSARLPAEIGGTLFFVGSRNKVGILLPISGKGLRHKKITDCVVDKLVDWPCTPHRLIVSPHLQTINSPGSTSYCNSDREIARFRSSFSGCLIDLDLQLIDAWISLARTCLACEPCPRIEISAVFIWPDDFDAFTVLTVLAPFQRHLPSSGCNQLS